MPLASPSNTALSERWFSLKGKTEVKKDCKWLLMRFALSVFDMWTILVCGSRKGPIHWESWLNPGEDLEECEEIFDSKFGLTCPAREWVRCLGQDCLNQANLPIGIVCWFNFSFYHVSFGDKVFPVFWSWWPLVFLVTRFFFFFFFFFFLRMNRLISCVIQERLFFEPICLQETNVERPSLTEDLKEVQSSSTDLSSPHLCFILVFICDLFVSRDDPLRS